MSQTIRQRRSIHKVVLLGTMNFELTPSKFQSFYREKVLKDNKKIMSLLAIPGKTFSLPTNSSKSFARFSMRAFLVCSISMCWACSPKTVSLARLRTWTQFTDFCSPSLAFSSCNKLFLMLVLEFSTAATFFLLPSRSCPKKANEFYKLWNSTTTVCLYIVKNYSHSKLELLTWFSE